MRIIILFIFSILFGNLVFLRIFLFTHDIEDGASGGSTVYCTEQDKDGFYEV